MKYDIKDKAFNEYEGFYVWNKPNFCINEDDKRNKEFQEFKQNNGFTPDETWSFTTNIALFILPRLKYFKEVSTSFPSCFENEQEWQEVLNKMIFSFSAALEDDFNIPQKYIYDYKEIDKAREAYGKDIEEGINLFAKYYFSLWW